MFPSFHEYCKMKEDEEVKNVSSICGKDRWENGVLGFEGNSKSQARLIRFG